MPRNILDGDDLELSEVKAARWKSCSDSDALLHHNNVSTLTQADGPLANEVMLIGDSGIEEIVDSTDEGDGWGAGRFTSFANLSNTIVGAGILSMSYAYSRLGYLGATLVLSMCVGLATYSINCMVACSVSATAKLQMQEINALIHHTMREAENGGSGIGSAKYPSPSPLTYTGIGELAYGRRGALAIGTSILALNFGAMVVYIVIIGDTLPLLLKPVVGSDSWIAQRNPAASSATFFILLPLSCLQDVSSLGYFSALSLICALSFVVVVIFLSTKGSMGQGDVQADPGAIDMHGFGNPMRAFGMELVGVFKSLPIISFAVACHTNVFPIFHELRQRSQNRMNQVAQSSMIFVFLLYMTCALCGYSRYRDAVVGDLLLNLELEVGYIIPLVQSVFLVTMFLTFPLQPPAIRSTFVSLVNGGAPLGYPLQHLAFSTCLVIAALIVASLFPDLDFVYALIGATAGSCTMYIFPALCYLKLVCNWKISLKENWKDGILLFYGMFILVVSTTVDIVDYARG